VGEGWNRLLTEIGRFMAVGGISTFAAFVVFNFLVHGLYLTGDPWLNGHPVTAFVIANLVGMVISYRLSRAWTFKHRPPQHADGGRTAFFVINVVTMTIPMACLWMSRNVFGLDDPYSDNLAGVVIGQLLGQVARFYLFRTYVFQKPVPLDFPHLVHWADEDEDVRFSSRQDLDRPDAAATDRPRSGRARPGGPAAGGG
jgi:putative flippase GtrA